MPQKNLLYLTTTGVGFLAVGLVMVSFKLYDFSKKNDQLTKKIALETSIHQNQISEILWRYDSLYDARNPKTANLVSLGKSVEKEFSTSKVIKREATTVANQQLKAINISARGVQLISNDEVETSNASKIDQMRIRFTLKENKFAIAGKKQILIQVINSKKHALVLNSPLKDKKVLDVFFNKKNTDACVFVDFYQHELNEGDYKINLIHQGDIIGTTNFRVN